MLRCFCTKRGRSGCARTPVRRTRRIVGTSRSNPRARVRDITGFPVISRHLHLSAISGGHSMRLDDYFGNGSILQRNERVKLAASFWNNIGAGMVIGGIAAAFFLDKPQGTWTKIGIAIAGL